MPKSRTRKKTTKTKARKIMPGKNSAGRKIRRTTVKSLQKKMQEVYSRVSLKTTCAGHCVCCHVACPQMNYSEFLVILDFIYKSEIKRNRAYLLKKSIEYFFSNSMIKPCPLLAEKQCSVYDIRPLSCRMYGIWPKDMYDERVEKFMEVTGLAKEDIPLNTQCEYVKRVDNSVPLTREVIDGLYDTLNNIDVSVGSFQKGQIKQKYNQRTFHDWFMATAFGEDKLSVFSSFFLAAEPDAVEDLVKQLCIQVDKIGEEIFSKIRGEVQNG